MDTDLMPPRRSGGPRNPLVDEFYFAPGLKAGGPGLKGGSRSRLLAALLAGVLVVALAGVLVLRMGSGSADAMVFKYAFDKTAKKTYALSMTVNAVVPNAESVERKVDANLGYEVVSTLEDGSSVVEFTLDGLTVTPNDGGFVPQDLGTLRVTVGSDGTVKNVEGSGGVFGAAGAMLGESSSPAGGGPQDTASSQFLFPQFPVNAIAPGDTWNEDTEFPLPFGDNKVTVHSTGKHNGFEETEFGRVARIHHKESIPLNIAFSLADLAAGLGETGAQSLGAPPAEVQNAVFRITGDMSMEGDSLVVPETGDLVRMDGAGKMSFRMQMEGLPAGEGAPTDGAVEMTMKMSMVRVNTGADNAAPAA